MELTEIQISNFRSIKDETVKFSHNCLILLGKNEAGKTNVLKAISSVFGMYTVSDKDKRKRIDNEKIDYYYVRAVFKPSETEFKLIEETFKKKFSGHENIKFKNSFTISDYIRKIFRNILVRVDIGNNKKPYTTYWSYYLKDLELEKPLFISDDGKISLIPGTKFNLEHEMAIIAKSLYNENPYKCHYWQYSDNFLLPNTVNIDEFISDPSSQKALENIFALCNREDIKKEFETAMSEDGDYSNLLEQISKKVTTTFHKIWKDFKGTSIQLFPNGDEISIKVVDRVKYNFEDRSDGFKKFISILLMLSTQSRANKILGNDIILIDEPDQSLYPTSATYLRDELIEISKKTKVVFSTHSQYMIDINCLDRHYIVEKKEDITSIKKEDSNAPYTTDELFRRAIGSSIFECLKPKNIIFEGYLDKQLFDLYCKSNKIENNFNEFGSVYLSGISGVETLTQILSLANKKFIIVADSDETSNNKRIDFVKNYPHFKENWLAYADVCKKISTMEDFFTSNYIEAELKNAGYTHIYENNKNANSNIEKAVNKDKELKQKIKNSLMSKAKKANIISDYTEFVNDLSNKLTKL